MKTVKFFGVSRVARLFGLLVLGLAFVLLLLSPKGSHAENSRVITIYHDGIEQTVVTDASTVGEVLKRAGVQMSDADSVEPGRDMILSAPSYSVNVYRARPVTVVDGQNRYQVVTSHTSAKQIAEQAGLVLYDEDQTTITRINDFIGDQGVGIKLTIQRAKLITLVLYGRQQDVRTQSTSVGELIKEKGIELGSNDGTSLPGDTPITEGMRLEIWRNGVQTITAEEEVAFPVELIRSNDKPVGYREVVSAGVKGKKLVTYEIELRNGKEIRRKQIQSVVVQQPTSQTEILGIKAGTANPVANQILGHQMMLAFGFGEDQWPCLLDLWNRESGWNQYKANYQGSGAYGIPQALPGSKMGAGWESDPAVQIQWGLGYIKGRYGTPCGALSAFMSRSPHWY